MAYLIVHNDKAEICEEICKNNKDNDVRRAKLNANLKKFEDRFKAVFPELRIVFTVSTDCSLMIDAPEEDKERFIKEIAEKLNCEVSVPAGRLIPETGMNT